MRLRTSEWAALALTVVFLLAAVLVTHASDRAITVTEAPLELPAATAPAGAETGRLDLNAASAEELEELPGIGPELAARIMEYRAENGPFTNPAELMNVEGIGEKTYAGLAERIFVGAARQEEGQ